MTDSGTQHDKPDQLCEEDVALDIRHDDVYSVILYNDDHNVREYVVSCLMQVFAHPVDLAIRIMEEAHIKGRSLAEVEGREEARLHAQQLRGMGLTVTVEKTT